MNATEFAAKITGRQYPFDLTSEEQQEAKDAGLLVMFGASDDLFEVRGVEGEEAGAGDGVCSYYINRQGLVAEPNCEDKCEWSQAWWEAAKKDATEVTSEWCPQEAPGTSWIVRTRVPHEPFTIMEDGETYCIGIVVDTADLPE